MIKNRDFVISTSETVVTPLSENVEERKIFYRLGNSEIFDFANKNAKLGNMSLVDVLPMMIVGDKGFVQADISMLDNNVRYEIFEGPRYKISCKKSMRQLIENGSVNMVYTEAYKVPTCIPYIIQGSGPKARVFVNISDFVQMDQYGKLQVVQARNYNGLMASLFAACLTLTLVRMTSPLPADLGDGMVLSYSAMMERAINAIVHMDPITKDKLRYLASEFALIQMYGTTDGQMMFMSRFKNKYFPSLSKMITDAMDARFQTASFDKFSAFILQLKELYPSMKGLSDYLVLDKWIRLFGSSTALTIDYIGYHLYTICMTLFESPLVTRMALEPIIEKNKGTDMYRRMQQVIGGL